MVEFKHLGIDGNYLNIEAEVEDSSFYKDVYIKTVRVYTQDNYDTRLYIYPNLISGKEDLKVATEIYDSWLKVATEIEESYPKLVEWYNTEGNSKLWQLLTRTDIADPNNTIYKTKVIELYSAAYHYLLVLPFNNALVVLSGFPGGEINLWKLITEYGTKLLYNDGREIELTGDWPYHWDYNSVVGQQLFQNRQEDLEKVTVKLEPFVGFEKEVNCYVLVITEDKREGANTGYKSIVTPITLTKWPEYDNASINAPETEDAFTITNEVDYNEYIQHISHWSYNNESNQVLTITGQNGDSHALVAWSSSNVAWQSVTEFTSETPVLKDSVVELLDYFKTEEDSTEDVLKKLGTIVDIYYYSKLHYESTNKPNSYTISQFVKITGKGRYVYGYPKSISLSLNSLDLLNTNLQSNMFVVEVECTGAPSANTPCGMDNAVTSAVAYNKKPLYLKSIGMLNNTTQCTVSRDLLDYILLLRAFELSIKACNYTLAFEHWRYLYLSSSSNKTSSCGCHARY